MLNIRRHLQLTFMRLCHVCMGRLYLLYCIAMQSYVPDGEMHITYQHKYRPM